MKSLFVSIFVILSTTLAFAASSNSDRPATAAEKATIAKSLMKDPVIRAAYNAGRKESDKCQMVVTSATQRGAFEPGTTFDYEADISCSVKDNGVVGGGTVYGVHIKGDWFSGMMGHTEITIDRAG